MTFYYYYTGQPRNEIPSNVTHIEVDPSIERIRERAFQNLVHLKSIIFLQQQQKQQQQQNSDDDDENVVGSGGSCCSSSGDGGRLLQSIGYQAFSHCKSLERILIPYSVKLIEFSAFWNCTKLVSIEFELQPSPPKMMTTMTTTTTTTTTTTEVIRIADYCFWNCTSLININFSTTSSSSTSALSLGKEVLLGCDQFNNYILPPSPPSTTTTTPSSSSIITLLRHRFDGLPIHKLAYYQEEEDEKEKEKEHHQEFNNNNNNNKQTILLDNDDDDIFIEIDNTMQFFVNTTTNNTNNEEEKEEIETKEEKGRVTSKLVVVVDCFGMNPFHILALSTRENLILWKILLLLFQKQSNEIIMMTNTKTTTTTTITINNVLNIKDKWGNTTFNYLCRYYTIDGIIGVINLVIKKRVMVLGLKNWRDNIWNQVTNLFLQEQQQEEEEREEEEQEREQKIRNILDKIFILVERYERMEVLSLLELAVWKHRIKLVLMEKEEEEEKTQQVKQPEDGDVGDGNDDNVVAIIVDRQVCRLNCKADFICSNVLPFL